MLICFLVMVDFVGSVLFVLFDTFFLIFGFDKVNHLLLVFDTSRWHYCLDFSDDRTVQNYSYTACAAVRMFSNFYSTVYPVYFVAAQYEVYMHT